MAEITAKPASRVGVAVRRVSVPLIWRAVRRFPVVPATVLLGVAIVGIFAPLISPHDPLVQDLSSRNAPPVWYGEGSWSHILGADHVGRDVFSRLIAGARISLTVVLVAITTGITIGTTLGLVAGYFGGIADEIIMRIVDVWLALPFLLIALVAVIVFGASFALIIILLGLLTWASSVRFVRAEVLVLKLLDYVAMARVMGASDGRILIRHIIPGVMSTIIVVTTLHVGGLILAEATLSFVGAGVPAPTPAWGVMVADGRSYISTAWWIAFFPGLAIFLVVMSFNFLGDWLRDRLDPRLQQIGR